MHENGFIATTVRRGTAFKGSGFVFWIDENLNHVHKVISVPSPVYPKIDNNKVYGGKRGFRGVRRWNNYFILATFDSILIYDTSWVKIGEISHHLFCDIHGIEVTPQGIWITSTGNDAVFLIDWNGKLISQIFLSEINKITSQYRHIPKNCDYRRMVLTGMCLHPNYISMFGHKPYVCCRRPGAIAIISASHKSVRWDERIIKFNLPHDARLREENGIQIYEVLETGTGNLIKIYLSDENSISMTKISLAKYGELDPIRPASRKRTNWLRGLLYLGNNSYLVGQAPARLLQIKGNNVVKTIQLDEYPDSAVFDIIRA